MQQRLVVVYHNNAVAEPLTPKLRVGRFSRSALCGKEISIAVNGERRAVKQHRIIARHTLRYLAVDRERLKVRIAEFDNRVSLGSDGALDCRALTRNVLIGYIDRKVCAAAVITDIIRTIFLYIRIDIINSYPDVCELDYHCAASLSVDILPRQARSVNLFYAAQKADFTTSRLFICFAARVCGHIAEIGHQRFSAPPLDTPFLLRITRTAHIAITAAADDAHTAISTPCPFVFSGTVPASS